jgi:hypothetical protein
VVWESRTSGQASKQASRQSGGKINTKSKAIHPYVRFESTTTVCMEKPLLCRWLSFLLAVARQARPGSPAGMPDCSQAVAQPPPGLHGARWRKAEAA